MNQKTRLVIVEDDPLIAFDIKESINTSKFEVCGVFHEAEQFIKSDLAEFDLALLDVNLNGEMDGIELAEFLQKNHQKPCLFITSYHDEVTVQRAKKVNPLGYVVKPFDPIELNITLELCTQKLMANPLEKPKALFVKSGSKLTKIDPSKIDYAQAYDMYTHLYSAGNRVTASQTLKEIERIFGSEEFIRVHRSYMVNIHKIEGICEDEILIGSDRIPIGRTYKKALFDQILTI